MNIILLVLTSVVTINAIRVPTVWPDDRTEWKRLRPEEYGSYHKKITINDREDYRIHPQERRLRKQYHLHKRPHKLIKIPPNSQYFHSKPQKFIKKQKPKPSFWKPIAPYSLSTKLGPVPSKPYIRPRQSSQIHYSPASSEYVTSRSSPLYKNYRDDRTSEHEQKEDEKIVESVPDVQRPSAEESLHEHPSEIPTITIYPGEGLWAKPGQKHKPYISEQKYEQLSDDSEEPDGYEIFLKGKKLYDKKNEDFESHKRYTEKEDNEDQTGSEESESSQQEAFVPSTMYVQVRRSEDEEHLPSDSEDSEGGRLKEVIKDSKIHTVYTEEGYEDSAYDHAGHEKEAEDSQGYKEYNKEEEKEKLPKKNHQTNDKDQEGNGSSKNYKIVKNPNKSKRKKYMPMNQNNLIKTESTITKKLKEQPDGTQMEITSGVTKTTNPKETVEVLPEIVKYSNPIHQNLFGNLNNDTSTPNLKSLSISSTEQNIRVKRFANDFPNIDVKTDYINGIIGDDYHKFNNQQEQGKYPYYNSKTLDPNSPLKYSENLDHIPEKTEGRMAFYEQASRVQCPEIDEDIEAIPKRIEDVEKFVNTGKKLENNEESEKSPRLGKLGHRIDCFKRKYFGENPLDSPFFKEREVPPVAPLFKVLNERSAGFQAHHEKTKSPMTNNFKKKYHSKFSSRSRGNPSNENAVRNSVNEQKEPDSAEIVNTVRMHENSPVTKTNNINQYFDNDHFSPEVEIINVDSFKSINRVTTEAPSLITTPNYSINITPKNIYDQIKLLDFLPSHSTESTVSITDNTRKGKLVEDATVASELRMRPNSHYRRRPVMLRTTRPRFNLDNFVKDTSRRVTVTPNSYRSDTYEQTPLDQMNVFADVINNIRNGSNDPYRIEATTDYKQNQMYTLKNPVIRMRVPPKKIHIKPPDHLNDRKIFYRSTTVPTTSSPSTKKSKRGSIRYAVSTEKDLVYDDYTDTDDDSDYGKKKIVVQTSTPYPEDEEGVEEVDSQVSGSHTTETIHKVPIKKKTEIIGLVPPSKYEYRTIILHQPLEELPTEPVVSGSEIVNNYHVLGMKPPSTKQKIYDYSEFQKLFATKNANNHKYPNYRRGKRSPNRKSYFEVVRGQNSEDELAEEQEEDDDYVPHRPKNWHWDETLKKIVYDKPEEENKSDVTDDESDVVEIEVEDFTPRNIQQTTTRRSFTSTTPLNGPSYVDFIQILKNKKEYVSIPDPTTKKDGIEMGTTTTSTTTVKTDPTTPPAFLSFVSKLRQNDLYKPIEEKNKTKIVTTTFQPPEEEEEDEDGDTDKALSNIQNSPGRGAVDIGHNFKIFDVNDFLPKVKSYSPRTEIDYSKYKTIQRPKPQSTTQTSTDIDEDIENVEEPTLPFVIKESDDKSSEPTTEGKLEIFEVSRLTTPATTTTTAPSTTTKIQKIRRRRPTTTQRTISASATNTKEDVVPVAHNKPKRVYRRRPTHIRSRTTTPKTEDAVPEESERVVIKRHKSVERSPKIVSLEAIIQTDQPNTTKKEVSLTKSDVPRKSKKPVVTVDEILKKINRLKEVSVEEVVSDYPDLKNEEYSDTKDEYFDTSNMKISLSNGDTTDRKLVISKDKQRGMLYYTSVR